jgi:hypothetical protein
MDVLTASANYTGCGRKKSPIWEANKFKIKEDTAYVFFISAKYTECRFNPLPLLFKSLLQGQKDSFFFQRAFNLHY